MSIFAYFKAKRGFEKGIQTTLKVLKNKKTAILIILIFVSGCFFYNQFSGVFPTCYANDYEVSGYLEHEKEWAQNIDYFEAAIKKKKEENSKVYLVDSKKEIKTEVEIYKMDLEKELNQMVGNAPIKEMIPSILKLDQRVAAFLIGIAKKESDWGRHAPSQSGKTCYNYWGYKGRGSRGSSTGYACFGSPEEAVGTVGKRIESLVSKNVNEPRKFVVWKCGSSCAGHDSGSVQKWISDVSLYFNKVMQIKNS